MKNKFYVQLFLVLSCLFVRSAYANYDISPVKLNLDDKNRMTSLQVKNNNTKEASFQITILKKVKKKGHEVLEESKDIVITPVIFHLPPKKSQLVRIALKGPVDVNSENQYTVSIKELPYRGPKRSSDSNTVQLITNFMVPLSTGKSK